MLWLEGGATLLHAAKQIIYASAAMAMLARGERHQSFVPFCCFLSVEAGGFRPDVLLIRSDQIRGQPYFVCTRGVIDVLAREQCN